MRPLRTTLVVTVLALAAVAVAACAPTPSGGGGGGDTPTSIAPTSTTVALPPPPPYEPLPNPPAIGRLKFFNSAGVQISGGNINDAPFAAYVQSSVPGRAGDLKATLYGALPKNGVPYDAWSSLQLTASPNYPNVLAPSALASSSLPLVSVTSSDVTLSQLATGYPNTATDSYKGLYQLRIKTSGPGGLGVDTNYSIADIKITGTTWSVVYQ